MGMVFRHVIFEGGSGGMHTKRKAKKGTLGPLAEKVTLSSSPQCQAWMGHGEGWVLCNMGI